MKANIIRYVALAAAVLLCIPVAPAVRAASTSASADAAGAAALMHFVDGRFRSEYAALERVAGTPAAQSANWQQLQTPLEHVAAMSGPGVTFFANPSGTDWVVGKGLQPHSLSDRPYFAQAMRGKGSVGDLVTSRSTGLPAAIVAVPIVRAGKVVGMLGRSVFLKQLSAAAVSAVHLGKDGVIFAVDRDGIIALHSNAAYILENPAKETDALSAVMERMLREGNGSQSYVYRGQHRNITYVRSTYSGWTFGYGTQKPA